MPSLLATLGLAAVATVFVGWSSSLLESSTERLSRYYGLPAIVHGAVITAIGSSFPELASAVLATFIHGDFDLGVGAIVGSAIFNILVIPAVATLATRGPLRASRDIVFKEALFYMLSVAVMLIMFALAVIYAPVPGGALAGRVTWPLAVIPLVLYGLYVFIQYADVRDHDAGERPTDVRVGREWALTILSLVVILASAEGLVRAAIDLGDILGTPSYIWGLTIVAAATSLPDTFVSVKAAQAGRGVTSLANVLGSNTFDLLVAIPAGVLVAGSTVVNFEAAIPMMAVLTLATIVLFGFMRTRLRLDDWEAYALLAVYALFIAFVAETGGLIDLVAWA